MAEKKKILVIEDDPFLLKVYKSKLQVEDFDVRYAADGDEGLALIQSWKPQVVLLDLIMPRKDGFEVLEAVHNDPGLQSVAILVFTNLGQPEDRVKCLQLGARDYIVKSDISVHDILTKIRQYVD